MVALSGWAQIKVCYHDYCKGSMGFGVWGLGFGV